MFIYRPIRSLISEITLLAILIVILALAFAVYLTIRVTRDLRKGRKVRYLLCDWMEDHEKHESS